MTFICEDFISTFVAEKGGLCITRKENTIDKFDFSMSSPLVCLTGYSKIIEYFITNCLKKIMYPVTIIIIETDVVKMEKKWLDIPKIKQCFTWNKPFEHPKLRAIPIGLNYDRQYNVLKKWLDEHPSPRTKPEKWLAVNHSPQTNSIRGALANRAMTEWNDFCQVIPYIPPEKTFFQPSKIEGKIKITVSDSKCYDVMSQYKFILSPPGAGEDTHRTWEALYIGCIPIIQHSTLDELYEDLPVVIVNNWNEVKKPFLEEKYREICENLKNRKYNLEKMSMEYWLELFIQ